MRVLIVDDDRDIREMLAAVLAADGYEPQLAVDGLDALEQLGTRWDARRRESSASTA